MSTVLVGNGPIVKEREMGEYIDSFDTVVRFNNYETTNYEKFVGQKTDIWATRICSTIKRRDVSKIRMLGIVNWCIYTSAIQALVPRWQRQYPNMEIISADICSCYSQKFGYNHRKNWLSVGMITTLYLLDVGYEKLHLYGFGGDCKKHYFKTPPRDPKFHNFALEAEKIAELESEGKVEIL